MSEPRDRGDYGPPGWMEPFLGLLGGRDEVVRLMSGKPARVDVNAPLALMQVQMAAQIQMLRYLRRDGLLLRPGDRETVLEAVDAHLDHIHRDDHAFVVGGLRDWLRPADKAEED